MVQKFKEIERNKKQMDRLGPGKALPGPWSKAGFGPCFLSRVIRTFVTADDIDIIGRSQTAVPEAFLALEREANKVGEG
jgi:hypothetical protein